MPSDMVKSLFLSPIDLDAVMTFMDSTIQDNGSIAILPNAVATIPYVREV
jgi:hypothetical protein